MNYTVRYQSKARKEYQSALDWYREKSIDAAVNFSLALKERVDLLLKQPDRFGKIHKDFREVKLKKYPFKIIYFIDESKSLVVISSIFHQKRDPKAKYRNLK